MKFFGAAFFEISIALYVSGDGTVLAQNSKPVRDLTQISLEDLMNVQVTSVSKKEQSLSSVASAIYVIESDDIRRSGATNIPDLLRTVPGVNVARIDAHTWAISVRGFNERFTRSVLALIDGRTVYSPLSGGVNWDQQGVPLEDIERIEVIRGPGGTVWGANAVNGVINIITKSALATEGALVRAGGGSRQGANALAQYGGSASRKGAWRFFGDYSNEGNSPRPDGKEGSDEWHSLHGGFRSDWMLSPRDSGTVQADVSALAGGQTVGSALSPNLQADGTRDIAKVGAGDILGRWDHVLANGSETSLQVYYDRYNRLDSGLREIRNTFDVDFHHHLKLGNRHDIVWGTGYRITSDNLSESGNASGASRISFNPPQRADSLFSAFIQDQIRLTGSLSLTLGSKVEHNGYTGIEYEPSAQLAWQPTRRQEVWISVARAVRQPTRTDAGVHVENPFTLPNGDPALLVLSGDRDATAARLHDLEVGYRAQISRKLSIDIATFLSSYSSLLSVEPGASFFSATPVPHLVIPEQFENLAHARSYGGELAATWKINPRWKITPSYSLIHIKIGLDPGSHDVTAKGSGDATPANQFQVRSSLDITRKTELDSSLFYVSGLRGAAVTPGYARFDTRLARRIGDGVEVSLVGQNLLSARHAEFNDSDGLLHTLATRNVYGMIRWRF